MAIPYNTTNAGTSIRNALRHSSIKVSGNWQHIEDIRVKQSGTWRDTKEVYVRSGGSWRLVHEGEHFLFNAVLNSNSQSEFSLSSWISGQGYGGNKIKGAVTISGSVTRRQVNLGNFSSDSIIYLRLETNNRIQSRGGNGGNVGNNGQSGQRALYTRTKFILDNGGIIAGGGGGGSGGNNSNYTYNVQQSYGCQKGSTCYRDTAVTDFIPGGGGGGGAGYPMPEVLPHSGPAGHRIRLAWQAMRDTVLALNDARGVGQPGQDDRQGEAVAGEANGANDHDAWRWRSTFSERIGKTR